MSAVVAIPETPASPAPRAAAPEVVALLLADARLPVAGHTQSAGLEPALGAGLAPADVPRLVEHRLATVVRVEAGTAVVALGRLRAGLGSGPVLDAWAARTPAPATRETSRVQGRALLRLLRRLWPDDAAVRAVAQMDRPPRPLVLAAAAAAGGLAPATLARVVGYDDVQTVVAAALKLVPMDPADAAAWVLDAAAPLERLVAAVADLVEPDAIPIAGSPQIEAWAQVHAVTARRLFRA